jgi:uncharacterized protein (TIGR03086 family)
MSEIEDRYRAHASAFQQKVAATAPSSWENPSPCSDWTARDVVGHIVIMHDAMLRPLGRTLSRAPSVEEDPLGAFTAARADVEAVLADPDLSGTPIDTPGGSMTAAQHIDGVISDDMVLHGWDLARATGQDDSIDPVDLERLWLSNNAIPPEMLEKLRTPGAFGPGVVVFGPEVPAPADAPLQNRLLGMIGRDANWRPDSPADDATVAGHRH